MWVPVFVNLRQWHHKVRESRWKSKLLHFPRELHGLRDAGGAASSSPFPFLLLSFLLQTASAKFRELRANCSKVKRTTPIMQPTVATSHPRTRLFILQIYYWHYVTRNCQTYSLSCLPNSFPSFTYVSFLFIINLLHRGLFRLGSVCLVSYFQMRCLVRG